MFAIFHFRLSSDLLGRLPESCAVGTFACDENGVIECVPQHLICGGMDECRQKNAVSCLLLFGYFQYIVDIANASLPQSNDTDFEPWPNCSKLLLSAHSL